MHTTCEQTCKHGIHALWTFHIFNPEDFFSIKFFSRLETFFFFFNPPRSVETTATTESPDLTWGLEWQACRNQTHLRGLFVLKRRIKQMFWFHFYFYHEALKQRSRSGSTSCAEKCFQLLLSKWKCWPQRAPEGILALWFSVLQFTLQASRELCTRANFYLQFFTNSKLNL